MVTVPPANQGRWKVPRASRQAILYGPGERFYGTIDVVMSAATPSRQPRFCADCGEALPPGTPRFCVACGEPTGFVGDEEPPGRAPAASTGPTVQLANARVAQEVIGGTVRLPASGAVPPGLWTHDEPPGSQAVLAIYAPLRAVRRGWSGQTGRGWRAAGSALEGTTTVFLFRAEVEWFPAEGCGAGLRLQATIEASSHSADEGRRRRGFRFGLKRDGPMRVVRAAWHNADGTPLVDRPLPQLQIMAPPRVPRLYELAERPLRMDARAAHEWAAGSQASGAFRPLHGTLYQEHTPAGRGCTLLPLRDSAPTPWWRRLLLDRPPERYRVRMERPLRCRLDAWPGLLGRMREEARALGLDLEPATAAEWWLDRNGHDGVIFSAAEARYSAEEALIIFGFGQLAQLEG